MEVSGETDSTKNYNGKADLTYYHGVRSVRSNN